MKISGYEVTTLNIPEDDPLANMPEEAGRKGRVLEDFQFPVHENLLGASPRFDSLAILYNMGLSTTS